jgi:hypothetical protein
MSQQQEELVLPRLCEVGSPGPKAGVGFKTFKEPVAQQLRA